MPKIMEQVFSPFPLKINCDGLKPQFLVTFLVARNLKRNCDYRYKAEGYEHRSQKQESSMLSSRTRNALS